MYCKTLSPRDYVTLGYPTYLFDTLVENKIPCIVNHFHRRWEYGMALSYLDSLGGPEKIKKVVDIGGAGSLFPIMAAIMGYTVRVLDPSPAVSLVYEQCRILGLPQIEYDQDPLAYEHVVADVVVSISTIEHVEADVYFLHRLLKGAKRGVFITTDFSQDGEAKSPDHLRTYGPLAMNSMRDIAALRGYHADAPDWDAARDGNHVFGYTFACMGATR